MPDAVLHPCPFTAETVESFPEAFLAFLRDNDIHIDNYRISDVPRYLRVSPRAVLSQVAFCFCADTLLRRAAAPRCTTAAPPLHSTSAAERRTAALPHHRPCVAAPRRRHH